jgi:hypothetical protein
MKILRSLLILPGLALQLVGTAIMALGWLLMVAGMVVRTIGAILAGFYIVTRSLIRFCAASRA